MKRFLLFHDKRHPRELGAQEIAEFLNHLDTECGVAPSMQNQALNAVVFLYRRVLGLEVAEPDGLVRARQPAASPWC